MELIVLSLRFCYGALLSRLLEISAIKICYYYYYCSYIYIYIYIIKRSKRPMDDWMTDDILVLKALRRKYESLWRKTRLTVHSDMYSESCMAVKKQLVRVNL